MRRHTPTAERRRMVVAMTGVGATQQTVASTLSISDKTLRRYYADELREGAARDYRRSGESFQASDPRPEC